MLKKLLLSAALVLGFTTANAQLVDGNLFVQGDILYVVAGGATEVYTSTLAALPTHDGTTGAPLAMPEAHSYSDTVIVIPDTVTVGSQTFNVTQIGAQTFDFNTTIKSITLGTKITAIGNRVFRGMTSLETLDLSSSALVTTGIRTFQGLTALTSPLVFPSTFTTFGSLAFTTTPNVFLVFNGPVSSLSFPANMFSLVAIDATLSTTDPSHLEDYLATEPFKTYYANFINTLSVSDVLADNAKVFVSENGSTLNVSGIEYTGLDVYSVSGAKVATSTDISSLSSGLYIALISTDAGSVSKKFVK